MHEGTLHAPTYAETHTVVNGQRTGRRYRYVKGQLEEDNISVETCPVCFGISRDKEVEHKPNRQPGQGGFFNTLVRF